MELEGLPQDTLQAVGICSGDTLWLMAPSDQQDPNASFSGRVKPVTAAAIAAPNPLGSVNGHEDERVPSETPAQSSGLSCSEDDAMQHPQQVSCS